MALRGVKVIELAGLAPTPFCGLMLADMGADVVRVDRTSVDFNTDSLCRRKRSIQINLKHPDGKECLRKLLEQADVLLEGFRPGVLESLGLSPISLHKINPRLIIARLTGYGQTGPLKHVAGHDLNYIAIGGNLDFIGPAGKIPTIPANFIGDFAGGSYLCTCGIVTALYSREKTGKGQVIDHSMTEGAAYLNSFLKDPIFAGPRGTNTLDGGAPFYQIYETKDNKYMTVGALEPQFYAKFLKGLGLSDTEIKELPFQTDSNAWPQMKIKFAEIFKTKTQKEWTEIFQYTDACVQPLLDRNDIIKHPHIIERKIYSIQKDGTIMPNPAPKFQHTPSLVIYYYNIVLFCD